MARIAFLKSEISPKGGLEKYARRLMDAFHAQGHEVVVLTTQYTKESHEKPTSFEIIEICKRSKISLLHLLRFDRACRRWLSENHVDAVFGLGRNFACQHYYRAGNGVHAAYLDHRAAFSGFLKRLSFAWNPLHKLILRAERTTYENPALRLLFTNSDLVKKELLQYYPKMNSEVIRVVHNGVEWKSLEKPFQESLTGRAAIQNALGLDPTKHQFLFVGHEYQRKGLEVLLQALSLLKHRNFELSVVGKDRHIAAFKKKALALGLKVHFFGAQKDTTPFYQAADTMVIPSYYDPFANVTVEALAMGLFTVSSVMNGGREVITDEKMGIIFRDFKPEALTRCLEQAFCNKKTEESASYIRNRVEHLDFSNQIGAIIKAVESTL